MSADDRDGAGGWLSTRADRLLNYAITALYALSLGMAAVAFPLLALRAGYDAAEIGLFVASSAVAQIAARTGMVVLLRRFPDKLLIAVAAMLMTASTVLLLLSPTLWILVASQLIQGVSRAIFWTANQTHAIRVHDSAVRGLAGANLANGVGSLAGPVACGALAAAASLEAAIAVAACASGVVILPAFLLLRLRPFRRVAPPAAAGSGRRRPLWTRPGVAAAVLMTASAGSWRGLLNSLVPVVLVQAGHDEATVGGLLACANAAVLVATPLSRFVTERGFLFSVLTGVVPTALGLAVVGLFPAGVWVAAAALFLSGVGGGLAQTVGPALASERVHPEERGQAIASTGTFRAVALFLTPVAASALVLALPAGATLAIVAVVMSLPGLALLRKSR